MSDEHFAGNQSGIAIRYKLNDLENIATAKETGFKEGLRRRIQLLNNFWRTTGYQPPGLEDIQITMQRNIPANYVEQADIVSKLRGHVSQKTLLDKIVTFIDDSGKEMDRLEEEMDVYAPPEIDEEPEEEPVENE